MVRRILWASLALAPATVVLDRAVHPDRVVLFALSALSLIPLAWLIGEATEHAAEHTGSAAGALLNASFGNAPELIIAIFAIAHGLPNVVRGSLAGSVVSNILLVLGLALIAGEDGPNLNARALLTQLGLVLGAAVLLLVPSVPGWHGNPDRHQLALLTLPIALILLAVYFVATGAGLRRDLRRREAAAAGSWPLSRALLALGIATVATALVSELLVHSLRAFARRAGLADFFIAIVVVAIVGNAAEHGGAILVARRGKMQLATEIAVSSSAQVALLVAPVVALLSFAVSPALPLSFRPVELAALAGSAALGAAVVGNGRTSRWEGLLLVACYAAVVVGFGFVGDR